MTPSTEATLAALRRGDLAGTRELRLPGIAEFPREIFGLAETLEVLDIGGGTLDALPDDLGRLTRLDVLFCSHTRFDRLPPVLGDCAALSQVGFRGCRLREVPGEALPRNLRWLTLTDNAIETLPDLLGQRPALQKLMLAGNRLSALPDSLAGAPQLELLRIAANHFASLPPWLTALPRLAWIAYAGNPAEPSSWSAAAKTIPWGDLTLGPLLGEGASGRIHRAHWRDTDVAVKLFKSAVTSDGLPDHEMEACLAAGDHPALIGALGRVAGHPEGAAALVMPLVPQGWPVLAGPPSLAGCTRDSYEPAFALTPHQALHIARDLAHAGAWLHGRGLLHGDLYAHNTLWNPETGAAKLGDFGAASCLPPGEMGAALCRIESRAWGIAAVELMAHCPEAATLPAALSSLIEACLQPAVAARPDLAAVAAELDILF